jgi:hypothetical protein
LFSKETDEVSSLVFLCIDEMKRLLACLAHDIRITQHDAIDQDHARRHTPLFTNSPNASAASSKPRFLSITNASG